VNRFGYTKTANKIIDNRKTVKTVTALSRATLPKESRRCTNDPPRERRKTELILLKTFLTAPIPLRVDFECVLLPLGRLLRLSETLAGDILCGLVAMCFVRYIQLKTRTIITARGRR